MPTNVTPTPGGIATELAELVNVQAELRRLTGVQIEQRVMESYAQIGEAMRPIMEFIQGELEAACQAQSACHYDVCNHVEGQLQALEGVREQCELAASQERSRLRRMGLLDTMPPADVEPAGGSVSPQISPQPGVQPAPSTGPTFSDVGPSSSPFSPLGTPPTREELAPLALQLEGSSEMLALGPLPPEYWDRANEQRMWWSLAPTVLTRVAMPAWRTSPEGWRPAGQVYLNVGLPIGASELQALIDALGVRRQGITYYTVQETWDRSVANWGEPVARTGWQVYGMPIPEPRPMRLSEFAQREDMQPAAREHFTELREPAPAVNGEHQVNVGDLFGGLLGGPLSFQRLCELLGPIYDRLGIPPAMRFPCVSIRDMEEALKQLYGR